MTPKLKECILNKRGNFSGTYAVKGFYDTITMFAIESIPKLSKVGVDRVGNKFPRKLNWKMGGKVSYGNFTGIIFK